MFYPFEKAISDKLDAFRPQSGQSVPLSHYGFETQNEGAVRIVLGFEYEGAGEGGGDRSSIGTTYLSQTQATAIVSLYAGQSIGRKKFLELFFELQSFLQKSPSVTGIQDLSVSYRTANLEGGYSRETTEAVMSIQLIYILERTVNEMA